MRYLKVWLLCLVFACLPFVACSTTAPGGAGSAATETPAPQDEGEFVSLFNGANLDGWHRLETAPESDVGGKWEVVNGVIEGDQYPPGRGGFLVTEKKFKDLIVEMEVNLDFPTDSGVFLRMADDGKSHQTTLDNVENPGFGNIYLPWTQGRVHRSPEGAQYYRQGEWNHVRVQIQGEPARIQFWLNGTLVTDFQHTAETTKGVPAEGYLGIQIHPGRRWKEGNKVRFRSIRIKEL